MKRFEGMLDFCISKTAKLAGYVAAAENEKGDPDVLLMLTRDANDARAALVEYVRERMDAAKEDPDRLNRAAKLIEKRRHYPVAYCRKLALEVLDAADGGSHD